jgi:hypothetical protein
MKYLKKFESLFGTAEPEKISYEDFHKDVKTRCDFTKNELLYLESIFDSNSEKISDVEYVKGARFIYNKFTSDKTELPDNFIVFLYSNTQNGELIQFDCYKHTDEWYYVWISQEDNDHYDDDLFKPGFKEYWRCDEFDSLKILLDKWL